METHHTPIPHETKEVLQSFSRWLRFAEFRKPADGDGHDINLLQCVDESLNAQLQPLLAQLVPLKTVRRNSCSHFLSISSMIQGCVGRFLLRLPHPREQQTHVYECNGGTDDVFPNLYD